MNKPHSQSLSNQLLKIVSILALIYLFVILLLLVPIGFIQADKNHKELEKKLALSLSSNASIALYVSNKEIADEVITSLLLHEEIDAVKLESDDGVVFASTMMIEDEQDVWKKANKYRLYSPTDGMPLGTLYIHDNHKVLQRQALSKIFDQVLFILIQFFLTVVALVAVFKRVVGGPLKALSQAVYSVTPGRREMIPIDKHNEHNELGVVVHSVNTFITNSNQAIERERELRAQLEKWERYYRTMAEQDTLTGLKNRLGCEKYIEEAGHFGRYIALLLVDLDGFKLVNDTHGHSAGDLVLKTLAERFQTLQSESNVPGAVGRIGGDEFVVYLVLQRNDLALLRRLALDLIDLANMPCQYGDASVHVGCSVGIATAPAEYVDIEALVHSADQAMYQVKGNGKNSYHFSAAD